LAEEDNNSNFNESNYRSAIKAFTWRVIGSLDTTIISFFQTGDFLISVKIGSTDFLSKIVLYYLHERAWIYFLGRKTLTPMISLAKAVAWRSIGSIDTAFWGWIYTGNIMTGLKIGGYELLTKILLYYIHERIWARVPIGSIRRVMDRVKEKLK
jgi:uncharacterized membrane protein